MIEVIRAIMVSEVAVAMSSLSIFELAVSASGPTTGASLFPSLRLKQPPGFLADSIQQIQSFEISWTGSSK